MKLFDARLDIDLRCNFKCEYCYSRVPDNVHSKPFPIERLETVLRVLDKNCWSIFLSCAGEPTLHPQFADIMRMVKKTATHADVSMITNGSILTDEMCQAIADSGISRVHVSIPTKNPQLYEKITGARSAVMEKVLKNIETLIEKRGKRRFPKITINMVATRESLPFAPELAQWAMCAGIDSFKILNLILHTREEEEKFGIPNNSETRHIMKQVSDIVAGRKKLFEYPYLKNFSQAVSILKTSSLYKNPVNYLVYFALKFLSSFSSSKCRMIGNSLRVNSAGDVFLCAVENVKVANVVSEPDVNLKAEIRKKKIAVSKDQKNICKGCAFYEGKERCSPQE